MDSNKHKASEGQHPPGDTFRQQWLNPGRKRFWAIVGVLFYTLMGFFVVPAVVKNSIIKAGYSLGWQMSDTAPGHLVGTLNIRSHQAIVDITYTPENYSINYKDSTNLKHKGNMIHSNYNAWIKNLSNAINRELSYLDIK